MLLLMLISLSGCNSVSKHYMGVENHELRNVHKKYTYAEMAGLDKSEIQLAKFCEFVELDEVNDPDDIYTGVLYLTSEELVLARIHEGHEATISRFAYDAIDGFGPLGKMKIYIVSGDQSIALFNINKREALQETFKGLGIKELPPERLAHYENLWIAALVEAGLWIGAGSLLQSALPLILL